MRSSSQALTGCDEYQFLCEDDNTCRYPGTGPYCYSEAYCLSDADCDGAKCWSNGWLDWQDPPQLHYYTACGEPWGDPAYHR